MTAPTDPAALREAQVKADHAIEEVTAIAFRPDKHGLRTSATAAVVALPMVVLSAVVIDLMALQAAVMPRLTRMVGGEPGDRPTP